MTSVDPTHSLIEALAHQSHIRGLIFDCDGTLVDTIPSHLLAFQEVFDEQQAKVPLSYLLQLSGLSDVGIFERINRDLGYHFDPAQAAHHKERLFLKKYLDRVRPIEPVVAIVRHFHGKLAMAVATGGFREFASSILKTVDLTHYFATLVAVEDVQHGKPEPDLFLEAARRLGIPPVQCHVFEDADSGVEAARRAGMTVSDVRPLMRLWRSPAEETSV